MHRFFLSGKIVSQEKILLSDKKQLHHIKDVLRLKKGEGVVVVDEEGSQYYCVIEDLLAESAIFKVKDKRNFMPSEKTELAIACAIPKNSKMDDIVDKLTQAGADRIIPLITKRVVVKMDEKQRILRQKRWEKIAFYASQQSQRNTLPVVDSVKAIAEVISSAKKYDLVLIPTLEGERKTLKNVLSGHKPKSILVFIGPEGDFTSEEIKSAEKEGAIPISLGNLVLRVETAAVAVCSFIRFYEND